MARIVCSSDTSQMDYLSCCWPAQDLKARSTGMNAGAALALQMAVVVAGVALLVVIAIATWDVLHAEGGAGQAAAAHGVDRALGAATLMKYEQEAAGNGEREEARQCCAICLSDYAKGDDLVRVVPACRHFFHAECGDGWLQARQTCPLCRGGLWPLPECSPMPPRVTVDVAEV